MLALAPNQVSNAANPVLTFSAIDKRGILRDLDTLEFQIFDVSTDVKRITPVQVFPVTTGTRHAVDVDGADRLGAGRYVASYTVDNAEPKGMHEVRWFWKIDSTDAESKARKDFEVITGVGGLTLGPTYCFVSDIRAEGFDSTMVTDGRLEMTIVLASRYIDSITGRFFEPRYITPKLDGTGGRILLFNDPIIGIEAVSIDTDPFSTGAIPVDVDLFRVFSRHLSQGLTSPDDRDNPKLEFVHQDDLLGVHFYRASGISLRSLQWPTAVQNCGVTGLFGYTERDGSPWGQTPALIRHAAKMLALREMTLFSDIDCREDWTRRWRLTSERTRDQQYTLADPRKWGEFTGDPEIDMVLKLFMRPPQFGAA